MRGLFGISGEKAVASPSGEPTDAAQRMPGKWNNTDSDSMGPSPACDKGGKGGTIRGLKRRISGLIWGPEDVEKEEEEEEDTIIADLIEKQVALQKNLDDLRKESKEEAAQLHNTVKSKQKDLKDLNRKLESRDRELQEVKHRVHSVTSELERQRREVRMVETQNNHLTQELHNAKAQCDQWAARARDYHEKRLTAEQQCGRLEAQFRSQAMQLGDLQTKYYANLQLLDQRTKELQGAQEYLHTTRTYSGADLIRLVHSLNCEMTQAAATITEALRLEETVSPRDISSNVDNAAAALENLGLFMSKDVIELFYTLDSDDLDPLIQSALQAAIAHCCMVFINSWSTDETVDSFVHDIYRKQGCSKTAGRWRAITKTHTKYASPAMLEEAMRSRMFNLIEWVLTIAGWTPQDNEHETEIRKTVGERVSLVMGHALQIDKVVGLEMTSEEWEVFTVPAEASFDNDAMEDVYGRSGAVKRGDGITRVLCTTDLGLRSRQGDQVEEVWQTTLKPKVLLNTAF